VCRSSRTLCSTGNDLVSRFQPLVSQNVTVIKEREGAARKASTCGLDVRSQALHSGLRLDPPRGSRKLLNSSSIEKASSILQYIRNQLAGSVMKLSGSLYPTQMYVL
jgi:hypothetical protein